MRVVNKIVPVEVQYSIGDQDEISRVFEGGVAEPDGIDEIRIIVRDDMQYDARTDSLVPTGAVQIDLRGSRKGYLALAQYLLSLNELETSDPDYHDHLVVSGNDSGVSIHLIVHAPHLDEFALMPDD